MASRCALGPRVARCRLRSAAVRLVTSLLVLATLSLGCQRKAGSCEHDGAAGWSDICTALDDSELRDAVVLLGDVDGRRFTWQRNTTPDDVLDLASASKWLASATLLTLVADGTLSLEDRPQDHLTWATDAPDDPRSAMTLGHLLSFTAGFDVPPLRPGCVGDGSTTLQACARELYETRHTYPPGEVFFYGPAHMAVAGAMAEVATGRSFTTLFEERVATPVGMSAGAGFTSPSTDNPRLAGGGRASAADYERFLLALMRDELLADQQATMHQDWTPSGTVRLESSPVTDFGYAWHYGLGNWLECTETTWSEACGEAGVVSSPGAYGFDPWIDRARGVYGVVARQDGLLRSPAAGSAQLMIALRPDIYAALGR